jgi:hypothetical protein
MEYQDKTFHDLQCKRIQVDGIWSFCRAKAKNVPEEHKNEGSSSWRVGANSLRNVGLSTETGLF